MLIMRCLARAVINSSGMLTKCLNAADLTITLKSSNDQAILSDLEICEALAEFLRNFSSSSYPDVVISPTAESLF